LKKQSDNRKVVVEDLVYIDDLDLLIYTTLAPRSSCIFITQTRIDSNQEGLEHTLDNSD
jgi:hypothetical protein